MCGIRVEGLMIGEMKVFPSFKWKDVKLGGVGMMYPSIHPVLKEPGLKMKLRRRGRQSEDNCQDCAGVLIKQHQTLPFLCTFHLHMLYIFLEQFELDFLFLAIKHVPLHRFLKGHLFHMGLFPG